MKVVIFCGSQSDKSIMKISETIFNKFNIKNKTYVISAHRLPDILSKTIKKIELIKELELIIAGAGLSAHLPGMIASKTIIPVIGVPIYHHNGNGLLGGIDALFSIIQMPKDIPVATVGINNAYNASLLAIQILAIKYTEIKKALLKFKIQQKEKLITEIES